MTCEKQQQGMYPSQLQVTASSSSDSVNRSWTCTDRSFYRERSQELSCYSEYCVIHVHIPLSPTCSSIVSSSMLISDDTFPHWPQAAVQDIIIMQYILSLLTSLLPYFSVSFPQLFSSELLLLPGQEQWPSFRCHALYMSYNLLCISLRVSKLETRAR